ncbi:hypothetical protein [Bathycoccus sp. RCC716 virus 1]|uniref:Uncharacterized protein n=1 Tax=Bathycoccus sp. RCC716 virus 1 TaxID=2530038 RepID=A0A7S6NXX3_9PHYC|nr:hypothetical protein [Bathycoccus sp. RCC716 virus 1]
METFGSRAQVFHGTALKTTGGLTKSDLVQDKYGKIVSKAARKAALTRMKAEGKQHLVKVFKPKKTGFKLQPKEGTKSYEKKVKKML